MPNVPALRNTQPTDIKLVTAHSRKMSAEQRSRDSNSTATTSNQMNIFRIWSGDRKKRKSFAVRSNQPNQLDYVIHKACEKLDIPSDVRTKLVLEEDGTEVDEDQILQQWASRTFLLLRADEVYHTERQSLTTANSSVIQAATSVTSDGRSELETSQRKAGKVVSSAGEPDLNADDCSATSAPVPVSTVRRSSPRARASINVAPADMITAKITALTSVAATTSSSKSTQRATSTSTDLSSDSPAVIPAGHKRSTSVSVQHNGLNPVEKLKRPRIVDEDSEAAVDYDLSIRPAQREQATSSAGSSDNSHSFELLATIKPKPLKWEEKSDVWGVTYVNGLIYCVRSKWSTISVFSGTSSFTLQNSIVVPKMTNPGDLVGSESQQVLYVIDFNSKCIWRINLRKPELAEIHIENLESTGTLTLISNNRLLITNYLLNVLLIFKEDGSFDRRVELDKKIQNPLHAVEVEIGKKFLISGGLNDYSPHQVVQVSISGRSKKLMFGSKRGSGPDRLNNPSYLAVERSQNGFRRVFVADELNGRIVVLDNELELLNVETVEGDGDKPGTGRPHRLCYVEADKKKLLLVASGQNIHIYEV